MQLPPIVDAGWVLAHRDEVVLADVRWYLDGRSGRDAFTAAHLPGATFVDLEHDLADARRPDRRPPSPPAHRRTSPPRSAASASGTNDPVIAYDDSGGGTAGRLVWMLRVHRAPCRPARRRPAGLARATRGRRRDIPTTHDRPAPAVAGRPVRDPTTEIAAAAAAPDGGRARRRGPRPASPARTASVDRRAGHIPGAANAPWAGNLDPETGRFRDAAALRQRFADLGVGEDTEVVCYCGSGVSACADLLALERAGVGRTRLYVPSWSGWSADPARPAAQGRE